MTLTPLTPTTSMRPVALLGAAALTLGLTACSPGREPGTAASGYPVSVQDCGGDVTVPDRPSRILTVGTAAVELLDAAGASDRITARSGEFGAPLPEGLSHPPSDSLIINPADPTTEEILAADPDMVLGYGLFQADAEQLRAAGVTVLTVLGECGHDATTQAGTPATLATVPQDLRRLGTALATTPHAEASAQDLEERVSAASRPSTGQSAAWVYYFSSEDALSAYGGSGLPASVLEGAGLGNVYAEDKDAYLTISVESLLERQPHWIVLSYGLYGESQEEARARLLAEPGVQSLTAVAEGRVVLLPADASVPGPSAISGLEDLVGATQE